MSKVKLGEPCQNAQQNTSPVQRHMSSRVDTSSQNTGSLNDAGGVARGPVSRVLSCERYVKHISPAWAAIHLGYGLLRSSSSQPGRLGQNNPAIPASGSGAPPLFGLAPGGVCHAGVVTNGPGALLPHPFTLACETALRTRRSIGGILSVALSLDFASKDTRRAGVTRHPCFMEPGLSSNETLAAARPPGKMAYSAGAGIREAFRCASTYNFSSQRLRRYLPEIRLEIAGNARSAHRLLHRPRAQPRTAIAVRQRRFRHRKQHRWTEPD